MPRAADESWKQTLERLKLLRGAVPDEPLRTLCHHDLLVGGLSIALDVKIDEALGPLLEAMGGSAPNIRVLDIRGTPAVFSVRIGKVAHEWEIDSLDALIDTLDRAFASDSTARRLVLLGEWDDMLQVWAVPDAALGELVECEWFKPSNRRALIAATLHAPQGA